MKSKKAYTGIDGFRLLAAFLIITIHTSPFASLNETGDFILTRIIARVGVPFFFMTSGFFLLSNNCFSWEPLKAFLKKTSLLYGAAILLYLPLNCYTGYFSTPAFLPNLIKDLVFDGTFYHLWYLPASIIGGALAWFLVKKLGFQKALVMGFILYIVGLLGDSYYGITLNIPALKFCYHNLFQLFAYTRNGLFFAPVFFLLGGYLSCHPTRRSFGGELGKAVFFFLLLLGEGLVLHKLNWQRHDSMYLMLLPCMYFLFSSLTLIRGKRLVLLKNLSLLLYLLHPMVIVGVRLLGKLLHQESLLIKNSVIHFLAVSVCSTIFSILVSLLLSRLFPRKNKVSQAHLDRAWLEISQSNLSHNVAVLKKAMPDCCELMAVVKAQAYGHGMKVASLLNQIGVYSFAVATIDEGIALRKQGVQGEILILGYTAPSRAKELHHFQLTQTLLDYQYSLLLNEQGCLINTHLKIDTGMHRLGFPSEDVSSISAAFRLSNLKITGIYTHLCVADSLEGEDTIFTQMQIHAFYDLLERLEKMGLSIPAIHIQSSYGLLNYPELNCDYVRAGVALYGVLSSPDDLTTLSLELRPVLSLKAKVVLIRTLQPGEAYGYGRTFVASGPTRLAILPIGYGDGFPRNLSGEHSEVLLLGQRAPIVGNICMDQMAVDITRISDVKIGSVATLIGKDGKEEILAATLAKQSGTITNELLSRLGQRLEREFLLP